MTIQQRDNGKRGGFYVEENNKQLGEMIYSWPSPDLMVIEHTEVNQKLAGQGVGAKLVEKAVELAREKGFRILPLCTFAKSVFDRTPAYADVLKK